MVVAFSGSVLSQGDDPFGDNGDNTAEFDPFGDNTAEFDPFAGGPSSGGPSSGGPFDHAEVDPFGPSTAGKPAAAGASSKPAPAAAVAKPPRSVRIWAAPDAGINGPIRKELARPLTSAGLDFVETPLEEVVEFLADEYGIEVHIDLPALDDLGLRPDDTLSVTLKNLPLRAALKLALKQLELVAIPQNGCLLITTEEEAATMLQVAVYPVGDLVQPVGFDALIDVIVSTVAAETWCENGGGEAEIRPLANGMLVVSQTEAVHDQIVALLEALRRVPPECHIDPNDLPKPDPPQDVQGGGGGGGGGFGEGAAWGRGGGQF